jgi:hypothetical protein
MATATAVNQQREGAVGKRGEASICLLRVAADEIEGVRTAPALSSANHQGWLKVGPALCSQIKTSVQHKHSGSDQCH